MVSCAPCLPPAVSGSGVRCGRACWARVSAVPRHCWLGCRGVFFAPFVLLVAGCPCPGPCGPCPPIPFLSGWAAGSFFVFLWCVSRCFGVPFPGGPLSLAWCCRFWLGGLPVSLSGSCLRCLLGGGLAASGGVGGRFGGSGLFSPPPPSLLCCFFFGGAGAACSSLCLPWAGARTGPYSVLSSGLLLAVRSVWPCSGPMGRVGYVHVGPLLARLGPGSAGWAAALGGCVWLWVRGLGLFVSFFLCGAGFNLLGGPPLLLPGALWPSVWPAVPVCGLLVRRLPGCAVACFG